MTRFVMLFVVLVGIALGYFFLETGDVDHREALIGKYESIIFSSGMNQRGVTIFFKNSDGTLNGSYVIIESSGEVSGRLKEIEFVGGRKWVCSWVDKYGEGPLVFEFNGSFTSFTGYWYVYDGHEYGNRWDGKRVSNN